MYSRELIMFDEFVLEVKVKVDDLNPVALHEELREGKEVKLEMGTSQVINAGRQRHSKCRDVESLM